MLIKTMKPHILTDICHFILVGKWILVIKVWSHKFPKALECSEKETTPSSKGLDLSWTWGFMLTHRSQMMPTHLAQGDETGGTHIQLGEGFSECS